MPAAPPYALTGTRPRSGLIDRLAKRAAPVSLDDVLDDLDRTGRRCAVPGAPGGEGFTWDDTDAGDRFWWPQGIASLRSGRVLLVSWYSKRRRRLGRTEGVRISVVDMSGAEGPRYRHVRLVAPRRRPGRPSMGAVRVHAGGIAVLGDLLYVADTGSGVRVFRLGDLLRSPARRGPAGYGYVLPQLTAYRVTRRPGAPRLRYSFVSIGQVAGRPNLVVGEYRRAREVSPRLARFPLDPATGLPDADVDGRTAPLEVYEDQPRRMQGVAVHGSTWFISASAGEGVNGDLYVGAPGAWVRHRRALPAGVEDLAWMVPGERLCSVTEWPGRRWVFPIDAGRL